MKTTPIQLDFRVSNKSGFFNKLHLYIELQPALNFVDVPELETIITGGINQGIGVKIHL